MPKTRSRNDLKVSIYFIPNKRAKYLRDDGTVHITDMWI